MPERPAPCPHCGWRPDKLAAVPWGDGVQRLPLAPYLCQRCGGLSLIELKTGTLLVVTAADEARLAVANPALWAEIVAARRAQEASDA